MPSNHQRPAPNNTTDPAGRFTTAGNARCHKLVDAIHQNDLENDMKSIAPTAADIRTYMHA